MGKTKTTGPNRFYPVSGHNFGCEPDSVQLVQIEKELGELTRAQLVQRCIGFFKQAAAHDRARRGADARTTEATEAGARADALATENMRKVEDLERELSRVHNAWRGEVEKMQLHQAEALRSKDASINRLHGVIEGLKDAIAIISSPGEES